jgi:hypothetical protein
MYSRNSNDEETKVFYHKYCNILNKVMKEAMSDKKIKTTGMQ